ncbi:MAG TPA: mechanosensitive ion channel family protein [Bryobacteraceae bacterium]|nr:mechanosensitive ion channel family protein [Bryobacteraceae bacterium]
MTPKPIWERLNIEQLFTQFVAWLPSLLAAVLIIVFFWLLFRATRSPLRHVLARTGFEAALIGMLINVYRFGLIAFGLIMAASQLGINVGAALAGLGVLGLTIGFAAKDSLSNIMAGFLIFWDKPFHVGQWVTVGAHYGKVAEITMRTTRVQTRDNKWIVIPNATVIDQILINHSTNGETRLQIPIGIGYKEDIANARTVILKAAQQVKYVLSNPAPAVVLNDLGASTVDLLLFVWVADAQDEKPAFFAVLEAAKYALDKAGIELPFPQLDLTVRSVEQPVWENAAAKLLPAIGR